MRQKMRFKKFPAPPPFRKLIGPSIIILGLSLGSGELILWPYLVSNFGLGIIWAAALGITFQFFINMEIERYSLAKGESIFVGFARLNRLFPFWFIFSTLIAWIWPGLIATSAAIFANVFNIADSSVLAVVLLLIIGTILTLGPWVYKTVETFQKIIILFSIPLIIFLVLLLSKFTDWQMLAQGLIGMGEGYKFLPEGISLLTFLSAMAFSGAGGNLNLAQSFYIKEKGYGMCQGTKGITSVLTNKAEKINLEGFHFKNSKKNILYFQRWWKLINLEHLLVFLITGMTTILLLALLSYTTTRHLPFNEQGINFLLNEARSISVITNPTISFIFLFIVGLMLFATQLTVLDSTSRIISENFVILKHKLNLSKIYYLILWSQIALGIIIFIIGYRDPLKLLITSAVINALAMFFYIVATYFLNRQFLPKEIQPNWFRKIILSIIWLFFGVLTFYSLINAFTHLNN